MHLNSVALHPDKFPSTELYPFGLSVFRDGQTIHFTSPVTVFVGENGTGKSTLLEAISHACGIHIWRDGDKKRFRHNPYEDALHTCLSVTWSADRVPGIFFGSDIFHHFAQLLDEWASNDPGQLDYFGGRSLMDQSHGQSIMSFFKSCFRRKGLYLLDEPETALSPRSQLQLLELLSAAGAAGPAQFIVATHSPILLACPGASLYGFDGDRITRTTCEETAHYRLYKSFFEKRS